MHLMYINWYPSIKLVLYWNWNECSDIEKNIIELLNNDIYIKNIESYYPTFIRIFDRDLNNKRLYDRMISHYNNKKNQESM